MAEDLDDLPEPDRLEGAPHPRETPHLFGQAAAEAGFLDAFNAGRLHHGWLITGPRGVGKATLAWKLARFLRATPAPGDGGGLFGAPEPPTSLDIPPDHPVMRQSRMLAEPGILLIRRSPNANTGKMSKEIRAEDVRRLRDFFGLSLPDGGRRAVIVDAADEMNPTAANALLKMLEEPPAGAVLFLVSHQPSRLLPTIRSRCRELRLAPLGADDLAAALDQAGTPPSDHPAALAELSAGSVGAAVTLSALGGLETYASLTRIFAEPRFDRPAAIRLAESASGAANAPRFDLVLELFDLFLARLARHGAGRLPAAEAAPGEAALLARLAPDAWSARAWASLAQELSARAAHGRAVNLDPAALILDMIFRINETAAARVA